MMDDLDKKGTWCLYYAVVRITVLYLCSAAVFYAIVWSHPQPTGVGSQFFAHWTAVTTCHVFAVNSFTVGKSSSVMLA